MLNKKIGLGGGGGGPRQVEMTLQASYSLTKWQAVQLTFFASCKMVDKLAQKFLLQNTQKNYFGIR